MNSKTKSITHVHPSRGPYGSTYQTSDAATYVRTPWGTRKLDSAVGPCIHNIQALFARSTSLRRLFYVFFAVAGVISGFILARLVA